MAELINRPKININDEYTLLQYVSVVSVIVLNDLAHRDNPPVFPFEQVLNMRGRKLQLTSIFLGYFKPRLFRQFRILPHRSGRNVPHKISIHRKKRDRNQILTCTQNRSKLLRKCFFTHMLTRVNFLLGDFKNILHPAHIQLQVGVHLLYDLVQVQVRILLRCPRETIE
ncbi:hypothetical protein D3C77_427050 [compost metagenome]